MRRSFLSAIHVQLSIAPAATQSTSAHLAAALMPLKLGGMLPPKIPRTELPVTTSVDCVPEINPWPFSHVYAEDGLAAWLL
ncbi:MAG: hypothetical protein WBY94_07110 [Polyangiaceae bacterium]